MKLYMQLPGRVVSHYCVSPLVLIGTDTQNEDYESDKSRPNEEWNSNIRHESNVNYCVTLYVQDAVCVLCKLCHV